MSEPVVIRVTRPYQTVEEFLEAEGSTIDSKGMVLVGAGPLPRNTPVRFVVSIATGEQLIRAEGVVREYLEPSSTWCGGLRVRFKRYGLATKQIIDRAQAIRAQEPPRASSEGSRVSSEIESVPFGPALGGTADSPRSAGQEPSPPVPAEASRGKLVSHPQRDELLARLRERARGLNPDEVLDRKRR